MTPWVSPRAGAEHLGEPLGDWRAAITNRFMSSPQVAMPWGKVLTPSSRPTFPRNQPIGGGVNPNPHSHNPWYRKRGQVSYTVTLWWLPVANLKPLLVLSGLSRQDIPIK